ncbi:hypothetical protein GCM10010123_00920 [Pilimelia anulata]|uniref:TIR domain-containing protein n=1 Tax=Pilimelia anulata TaxID=53371 RepID=A0A8J3F7A6_9ACTN|nr:toll/interleukin-1 receptor domain-containing protein [Pilimelia anulata]GGJ74779.1 hypothetical protein GCM10010123_00920 [Pilimelia anulata]
MQDAEVFLSYSRTDLDAALRLAKRLDLRGRHTWLDLRELPAGAQWRREIAAEIENAPLFVFLLTPDSAASPACREELDLAERAGKRIIPVLHRAVDPAAVPPALADRQWVFLRDGDDFGEGVDALLTALAVDTDWAYAHTRLLRRARDWDAAGRGDAGLLTEAELAALRGELADAPREPRLTNLQSAYVAESQAGALRGQRRHVRGYYVVAILLALVQFALVYGALFDELSESALVVLAPTWLLPLIFGLAGLLARRPSLPRMLGATAAGGLLLYVLYVTVWPAL